MSFRLMSISSTDDPAMISNDGQRRLAHVDLDDCVRRAGRAQLLAEPLARLRLTARARPSRRRRTRSAGSAAAAGRAAALRRSARAFSRTSSTPLVAHHVDAEFDQVADHRLDVAADVADLGELRGLDLEERRLRQLARAAGRSRSCRRRSGRSSGCSWARSPRRAPARSFWRRMRLRSAMATARLAAACPTTYLSSSATICRGVSASVEVCVALGQIDGHALQLFDRRCSRWCRCRCRRRSPSPSRRSPARRDRCCRPAPSRRPARTARPIRSPRCRRRAR